MRYSDIISERVYDRIPLARTDLLIFKNGSKSEFEGLLARKSHDEPVRGLLDVHTGDLYFWDGFYAPHGTIKDRYDIAGAMHLMLESGKVTLLTLWRYNITAEEAETFLRQNKNISRIYRGEFELIIHN